MTESVPATPLAPGDVSPDELLPHARYNFLMLVGDVSCFVIGSAFLDAATALPAIVTRLGGGLGLLGIMGALRQGAYFLPQLFIAHHLQNATRYKPILLLLTIWGRVGYLLAGVVVYFFGKARPELALGALVFAYGLGWFADGCGGVPWTALIGRTVPARRRGALFAATQTISGVGKLGVGAVVLYLLGGSGIRFPVADALLIWGCALFLFVSWLFIALIREPPTHIVLTQNDDLPDVPKQSLTVFLATLPRRFAERPAFARLAVVQVLASASLATAPFLWGYIRTAAPDTIRESDAGRFLVAQTVGLLVFAPIWGAISDRGGPKQALTLLMGAALLWPLLAFAGAATGGNIWLFYAAYFILGGVVENWVVITNYLLESVGEREQSTYIGLLNAVSLPALLLPLIAGFFASGLGAGAALAIAALLLAGGWYACRTLPDTR
ncbi:MAG: hypothetical protein H7Y38_16425 [Armatimonadetes bacterium]|nr:hypothetical protein [Armatimonadota bacterium]